MIDIITLNDGVAHFKSLTMAAGFKFMRLKYGTNETFFILKLHHLKRDASLLKMSDGYLN